VERGGAVRNLTQHTGEQRVLDASFSHDGSGVWLLSNLDRDFVALVYLDLASGEQQIAYAADWDVETFKLSSDGRQVALSINDNGVSRPVFIQASGDIAETVMQVPAGVIDQF